MAATCSALRAWKGRFWREKHIEVGPSLRSIAFAHATADSVVSQGRHTSMLGIRRSVAVCSTGWWVGPSSPRPIESWVNTKI